MVVMLAALAYSLTKANGGWPLWLSLLFFLLELFLACLFCHSAATRLRPQRTSEATLFYLLFAAGGALGSFLIGIAAPSMFTFNLDLPITFLVTALLILAVNWSGDWNQRLLWAVASAAMLVLVFLGRPRLQAQHDRSCAQFLRQPARDPGAVKLCGRHGPHARERQHPARNADHWG